MDSDPKRILVVLPTWVGDTVMATPTLRALRLRFPRAHIAWMGAPAAVATLAGLQWADECFVDPSKGGGLKGVWGARRRLRQGRFDAAVMLSNAFRVALVCRLGGVGRRIGYDRDGRGWLLTDRVPVPRQPNGRPEVVAAIRNYQVLAERLGCDVSDSSMHLAVEPADAAAADAILAEAGVDSDKPLVLINPGASFGSSKLWPPERFAAVADRLIEQRSAQVVINAAPAEKTIARAVGAAMAGAAAINFADRDNTLGLLKALTARAALMITGDTGPRHIAGALGCPVVTLFGSTDPDWTTLDCPHERIVRVDVPCAPCQKKLCQLPAGDDHHQCMKRIATDMVLAAADELLNDSAARAWND